MSPKPNVPTAIFADKNLLASEAEWLWMYEVTVPSAPPERLRLVSSSDQVVFRGNTYYPFPIIHSKGTENLDGDTRSISLTVSNISRELAPYIEEYDGLIGQNARIICTTRASAASSNHAVVEQDFRIIQCRVDGEAIVLRLDDLNVNQETFPKQRFHRTFCRFQYRSAQCGYSVPDTSDNYLPTCDKSLDGPNGCNAHGVSEDAEGVTRIHPARFGGFPGIPLDTTRGVL